MNSETRPSLLLRLRDPHDHAAWREFDERYRGLILRYSCARGLQPCDAEDVRQLVMMGMAHALKGFHYDPARGRFRDYLRRSVVHAIYRNQRGARANAEAERGRAITDTPDPGASALDLEWEREWMLHHYRLALRTARASVEPRSVEIFERLLEGQSEVEAAHEFGVSIDAVHKVKQRMRDRLKGLVASQIDEENARDDHRSEVAG